MYENANIEIIARGVVLKDEYLLLCQGKKSGICYLPGGHVEFGETARQALVRELREELGVTAQAGEFLGCCEHSFIQAGQPHAEINLVFALQLPGLMVSDQLRPCEDWLHFFWHPLTTIHTLKIEPRELLCHIQKTRLSHWGHLVTGSEWGFI